MSLVSLANDGTHIIPIVNMQYSGCPAHPEATGELRWHPATGAALVVYFPNVSHIELQKFYRQSTATVPSRTFQDKQTIPDWNGQTPEGNSISIYSINQVPFSESTTGTNGSTFNSKIEVEVFYAIVGISKGSPLSFWHQTSQKPRMLCLGFGCSNWQKFTDVEYQDGDCERTITHCSTDLSSDPLTTLVSAGGFNLPYDIKACWLVSDESSSGIEYPLEDARNFVSFLNGRRTSFVWHDIYLNTEKIQRTYYGWQRVPLHELETSYTQPLPIYGTIDSINYAGEIVPKLPALFSEFVVQNLAMRISFILNPIWTATSGVIDDRCSLTCLSLERLATAWSKSQEKASNPQMFSNEISGRIRKLLTKTIVDSAGDLAIDEDQVKFLKNKIQNLCAPPNRDKLSVVFSDLGIALTRKEISAVDSRNVALHGNATLKDYSDIGQFNDEAERSDILQMLVTKAVLKILKYKGPFSNLASRSAAMVEYM